MTRGETPTLPRKRPASGRGSQAAVLTSPSYSEAAMSGPLHLSLIVAAHLLGMTLLVVLSV